MDKYKKFTFNNTDDAIKYLKFTIENAMSSLHFYCKYLIELKEITISNNLVYLDDNNEYKINLDEKLPAYIYEDLRDKLACHSVKLLNIFGDHSTDAISYKKFRDFAKKNSIDLNELDQKDRTLLNSMTSERNFNLHITESMLNALLYLDENIYQDKYKLNLYTHANCTAKSFAMLYLNSDQWYSKFLALLKLMLNDYEFLINGKTQFSHNHLDIFDSDESYVMFLAQLMNSKKFKSDKAYNFYEDLTKPYNH